VIHFSQLMGHPKQTSFKGTDIISASEIGQYHYCSVGWYLQKCGYKPQSVLLERGTQKHVELGKILDHTQKGLKRSRLLAITGYLLLVAAIIIILVGVII